MKDGSGYPNEGQRIGTSSLHLMWHPTGDDGTSGTADHYDLRYRTDHSIVTTGDWDTATPYPSSLPSPPKPYSPTVWEGPGWDGEPGFVRVGGLNPDTTYYFGLKAVDDVGLASPVATSSASSGTTTDETDMIEPFPVTNLVASNPTSNAVTLTWNASADDFNFSNSNATCYYVRYIAASAGTMTEDQWFWTATQAPCNLIPKVCGQQETFTVTGLNANTDYYFAVRAVDEHMNWSTKVVTSPATRTLTAADSTVPATINTLAANKPSRGSVRLTWTAPGDDITTGAGTATTYDIRYRTGAAVTTGNWATALQVTGEPVPKVAGTVQTMDVRGLTANQTYYFAMKTADEVPNWSAMSNCPPGVLTLPTSESEQAGADRG